MIKKYPSPVSSYWQKETHADLPERLHNASTQKRAAAVQEVRKLEKSGLNMAQISTITGYSRATIKKYLLPDFDPAFSSYGRDLPSKLKPYCDTINVMLDEHKKFREIEEKIRSMGYHGSDSTIWMYASRKRRHDQAAAQKQIQDTQLIVRGITEQQLNQALTAYPQLLSLYDLIRDFKAIFAAHHVDDLGRH